MYSKPLRVQAPLLPRQVREVLRWGSAAPAGRRTPTARAGWASGGSSPSGNRVSDQISISVSSGPSGRNRYDEALLYIGSTKKWGKQ